MKSKIFRGTVFIVILIEIISIGTFTWLIHNDSKEETARSLKSEAEYVAAGYTGRGESAFDRIDRRKGDRVTVISNNGKVIYDSFFSVSKLGNHKDRPEFTSAMKYGTGYSERYSNNMKEQTIYYAIKMDDGNIMRLSTKRTSIWQLYLNFKYQIILMILSTLIITLIVAQLLSKSLVKPINSIDLKNPLSKDTYPEILPLVDRIEKQNKQIDEQVNELEEAVVRKTKEAEFRNEFTANVSHSLKTPLTSISGFAELIESGIAKEEDVKPFASRIVKESARLRLLVDDIIKISKMDNEENLYHKEEVDIFALCEKAISELDPVAKKKDVELVLNGFNITVLGVEDILYDMIFNLIDNAIRYNNVGGKVTIEVAKESVTPYVSVEDTGIGIPKEYKDRVFERFFMVDKSHSSENGGTGLGLAIVKHGAMFHGANITLNSDEGTGTKITISF